MAEKLNQIIELQDVKLVIELDDADKTPETITKTFVITNEVELCLDLILKRIISLKGCGTFIKGNFGSGKSHFLSFLYILLNSKNIDVIDKYPKLKELDLNILKISLVKFPANISIERIVIDAFGFKGDVFNRDDIFKNLIDKPTVIIIDELSEFLRSKPDNPSFYEDIRFLQFLGEFSFTHPMFIIASLQEWIEETGHISSTIFNRIKDRYPLRLSLSSSHIEDIIDQRIIIKKQGALDVIKNVFNNLKEYYPHLSLGFEEFKKTYPLHPFTVRFLSGLTPIFSQHRGVIQFVFSEVKKTLSENVDHLITPECIFDHFEERIREIPEYSPFVCIVYDYYKSHMNEILLNESNLQVALATIKLLILTEISPFEKRKSVNDISEILLKKISTLTSEINYEFINEAVLTPIVNHKMYIEKRNELFSINVKADERVEIKAKLKTLKLKYEDRNLLFKEICNMVSLQYLPLKDIWEGRKYKFLWQNSLRECAVFITNSKNLNNDQITKMINTLETKLDGYLVLLSPFSQEIGLINTIKDNFSSKFTTSLIFWAPTKFTSVEIMFLEEYLAKLSMLNYYPVIKDEVKRSEAEFKEIITKIYFAGNLYYASGKNEEKITDIGYLPIDKLLSHIFDNPLSNIHPHHSKIMPRIDFYSSHNLNSLFINFVKTGKITIDEAEKRGLTKLIDGLVKPLGIIKKKGASFRVSLNPENELVSHTINLASQQDTVYDIKKILKKGNWGLEEAQINLLLSCFIISGHLVSYKDEEIVDLNDIQQLYSGEINKLKPGKTLPAELLGYLSYGNFIWGEVEDVPTPLTQKKMWTASINVIKRGKNCITEINSYHNKYKEYSIFKRLSIDFTLINRLAMFFNSIIYSLSPSEGITKILTFLKESKNFEEEFNYLQKILDFFQNNFQTVNKYFLYLSHHSLKLNTNQEEKRETIFALIKDLFNDNNENFNTLKLKWDEFFDDFTTSYKTEHDSYYNANIFDIKSKIEANKNFNILKRVANIITSVTFKNDYWEIKRELEKLPPKCNEDLNYELFINPICRCGFKINDNPQNVKIDLTQNSLDGINNFLKFMQLPQNREKLDSYILSLTSTKDSILSKNLATLINLNLSSSNISLIYPLLNDETLTAIEHALKGKWKLKEVKINDLMEKLKGRRLKFAELKEIFLNWAGSDEESIIWIKDSNDNSLSFLNEELKKYGPQGESVIRELGSNYTTKLETELKEEDIIKIENDLEEEGKLKFIEDIKFSNFSIEELFKFLETEKLKNIKRVIRNEIFFKLCGKIISKEYFDSTTDETMLDILHIQTLLQNEKRYKDIELFTQTIAPLNRLINKLNFENGIKNIVSDEVQNKIENQFNIQFDIFNKLENKLEGACDITHVESMLNDVIVIFDGLRYDLWQIFKEILINEGFNINEKPYFIEPPTNTENFRKSLGILEQGFVSDKKYALLKFAEKEIGKNRIKNFLKNEIHLKFLHFNFIDTKVHNSTLDLHPLFILLKEEFITGILPILKDLPPFHIISDHGFTDSGSLKGRYTHGKGTLWEIVLPAAAVS